jgi:hypothetical protein
MNPKSDDSKFINQCLKIKDKWASIVMCHHIIGVSKWTCVPCVIFLLVNILTIEINPMNF